MSMNRRRAAITTFLATMAMGAAPLFAQSTRPATFTNPIIRSGDAPDPWMIRYDGNYYFTATLDPEGGVWVWKAPTLTGIDHGQKVKVWTAPKQGPASHQIWAPELHHLDSKWYLYFTASDGADRGHRHYVLEASAPMGPYEDKGRVDPDLDSFAIDGTVLEIPGKGRYWVYSTGKLWIAPMTSPTHVDGSRRVQIARATLPWERGWIEAPEELSHDGRIFLIYSAGHSGTPNYSLGMLELEQGADPLNPASWQKSPRAVFAPYFGEDGAVYTVGHCSFTTSPDGKENWIVYHGKDWRSEREEGFAGRKTRAQKFEWNPEGKPVFGHPIPSGVELARPSGERE